MKRAVLASLLALLAMSCTAQRRAQVLVTVDAQPGVDRLSDTVQVRIWGRGEDEPFVDDQLAASEPGTRYPWTVALFPRNDDISRYFRFEAVALSPAGEPVATARVISGYQHGQVLHVYLLLQDACIGVPCEELSSTCRNGMCVDIPDPTFFDPDAGFPDAGTPPCESPSVESCDRMDNDCDGFVDETFDLLEDEGNCGACARACDPPHATGMCEGGSCVLVACDVDWADCNDRASDGCEANLLDPATCGSCTVSCTGATPFCEDRGSGPACVSSCTAGTECGGSCVDTQTDELHCGGCDAPCATAPFVTTTCQGGVCTYECVAGRESCNGPREEGDGCEQDVTGDPSNCGSCMNECPLVGPCREPTCTAGACGSRPVMDGRSCDAGGDACPDQCMTGACVTRPCPDAGVDAGRDAGRDAGDAGRDSGTTCGASTCTAGETCCNGVCCNTTSGDVCCNGVACCTMGLETCNTFTSSCEPIGPPDAGGGCDAGCPAGDCCADGVTCCPGALECCDGICCDNSLGEFCDGFGGCSSPDAGGGDPCGGCPMGPCCVYTFGQECCDLSMGEWCSSATGCTGPVVSDAGVGGASFDCGTIVCTGAETCCMHDGSFSCCVPGDTCNPWGCGP